MQTKLTFAPHYNGQYAMIYKAVQRGQCSNVQYILQYTIKWTLFFILQFLLFFLFSNAFFLGGFVLQPTVIFTTAQMFMYLV